MNELIIEQSSVFTTKDIVVYKNNHEYDADLLKFKIIEAYNNIINFIEMDAKYNLYSGFNDSKDPKSLYNSKTFYFIELLSESYIDACEAIDEKEEDEGLEADSYWIERFIFILSLVVEFVYPIVKLNKNFDNYEKWNEKLINIVNTFSLSVKLGELK